MLARFHPLPEIGMTASPAHIAVLIVAILSSR